MIKVIRSETQYDDALEQVYTLMQTRPTISSPEGNELDLLVTLIDVYETVHYPMTKRISKGLNIPVQRLVG